MKKLLFAVVAALALSSIASAAEGAPEPATPPNAAEPARPGDAVPAPEPGWQTKLEEKLSKIVTVNFQDTTLNKALEFFRRSTEANIILDTGASDLSEKRLTLVLNRVRAESGLAWTARLMGLDYIIRDEAIFLAKPDQMPVDWRGAMQERYRRIVASGQESWWTDIEARLDKPVKVAFKGDPLPAVVGYLATESGINIVLDGHLAASDKSVRLEGEMTVKSALGWVAKLADVKYVIRDEVIYVATPEALAALRLETGESPLDLLFRRPVTFHFLQTPLRDALDRLSRLSNVAVELQGVGPDETLPVSVEGEQVEVGRAVRMVMNETGRPYAISFRGKTIQVVISSKGKAKPAEPVKEPAAPKKPGM